MHVLLSEIQEDVQFLEGWLNEMERNLPCVPTTGRVVWSKREIASKMKELKVGNFLTSEIPVYGSEKIANLFFCHQNWFLARKRKKSEPKMLFSFKKYSKCPSKHQEIFGMKL